MSGAIQIQYGPRPVTLSDGAVVQVVRLERSVVESLSVLAMKGNEIGSQARANQYIARAAIVGGDKLRHAKDGSALTVTVHANSELGVPACGVDVYNALPTMKDVHMVLAVATEALSAELVKN